MRWTPNDAERHTHKATTWALKELWARVANESLERNSEEGRAMRGQRCGSSADGSQLLAKANGNDLGGGQNAH